MPRWILFLIVFSGLSTAVYGALAIALGVFGGPIWGGLVILLGTILAFTGLRWAWTGEGPHPPRNGAPVDEPSSNDT